MSVASNLLAANVASIETDATGWTAGASTTRTRSTARFYSGVASLLLTATAAGSVTATTASRVAVVAGTEYTSYAYFANITSVAGRTATVSVSWYANAAGGSPISTSTSAALTLATATTWSEPPPILIATAPVGAAFASVTVTVTGLAAAAAVAVDVISLGPPNAVSGNFLPYNTQGLEVSAVGWAAETNATIARTTTDSYEGWACLQSTSGAAGSMEVRTVASVPVTVGTEYLALSYVRAPAAGLDFKVQILWLDGASAPIGTRASYTWQPTATAGSWTRCTASGVAPAGAVTAKLVLTLTATAAGQVWITDQMSLARAALIPQSFLNYNAQSIEMDASAWNASANCTIARSTARSWEGAASLMVTPTGAGDAIVRLTQDFPVTPRQVYRMYPYVYHGVMATDPVVDMLFSWYDADGVFMHTSYYRWIMGAGAGWWAPLGSAPAPAGAAKVNVGLRFVAPTAGDIFYVDHVAVGPGGVGVVADPIPDAYGASIHVQGLTTSGYTYWSLMRMTPDGALTPVRGPDGDMSRLTITGDTAVAEDYEAPLGESIRYYMKRWTTDPYAMANSDPLTLPEPPDTTVILKDPGLPARSTTAVVGTLPDWTRAARQGVNAVRGRARPVVISDVRTSRTGTLTLVTQSQAEIDAMWWLLETGNVLLLQWPRAWGERDVYVTAGDATEAHIVAHAEYMDRTWSVPLIEVDRPIGGVTGSGDRTWSTVSTESPDWLTVLTTSSSWLDVYTGVEGA
ncbi:hypothetical protein [Streptomyces niveus]|uniref:hypothetical protein n=1 Tax=Streptomyces niveus TaxID=193462 RepID=UPI00364989CD